MENEKKLLVLKCSVEDIIFRNPTNGYTVLEVSQKGNSAVAVGMMTDVNIGDDLKLIGVWKNHPEYGEQFAFEYYELSIPTTAGAILKYLSSGAVKGIGRATARQLVNAFGDNTLEVILKEPARLEIIKGISHQKAIDLCTEMKKIFGMRELMLYLEKFRLPAMEIIKIWRNFGDSSISMIEKDPYILCRSEIGVSFDKADQIALALKFPIDDKCRLRAGIEYIITYNSNTGGHTCLPKEKVIRASAKFLKVSDELVKNTLKEMTDDTSLIADETQETTFIFKPKLYRAEYYSAGRINMLLQFPPEEITGAETALKKFEKENHIQYAEGQKQAIIQALSGGLLVLTGGPGTGKTTALNAIISLYHQCGLKVALAAPTGRAAQRMSEVTGCEAKTIHRLLGVEWDGANRQKFSKNEHDLLDCDALIIDELSMVDVLLLEAVLRALPLGCRLILVGDSDQLPSVGAGNVLGDIIDSGKIPVVRLTEIFRQSMQSLIITNAHKIVKGEMPDITRKDNDFFFIPCDDQENIADMITGLYITRLPKAYGYSPLEEIQILCPSRKGDLGVTELNKKIQHTINPSKDKNKEIIMPSYTFRVGDKVMQTRNNYDLSWTKDDGTEGAGVFNGDIGRIEEINKAAGSARVRFEDKIVIYTGDNLSDLDLAYATTVHKSQGNEFTAVIMPIFNGPSQLYYRNLLYTAVTRAKKILILIGSVSVLRKMVDNNKKTMRYSGLKAFLERGNL